MSAYGYESGAYGYAGYGYGYASYGYHYKGGAHPYQISKGYAVGGYPIDSVQYGGYAIHSYVHSGSTYSITSVYENGYSGRVGYYSEYNYSTGRGDVEQRYISPAGDTYFSYDVFTSAGYQYHHSYRFDLMPSGSDAFSSSTSYTSYYGSDGANSQYELDKSTYKVPNSSGGYEFITDDTYQVRNQDAYGYTTYAAGSFSA